METHVVRELRDVVERSFPVARDRRGILGHSMGGHGALSLALRNPGVYRSVSALAPIVAPTQVPWGQKAFANYLGEDRAAWAAHDTCELLRAGRRWETPPMIDQGTADKFLERELRPELLAAACAETNTSITYAQHTGYDHSYYFVASMIEEQLRHHAALLT
jgi:S-formylglutathione hydrolase